MKPQSPHPLPMYSVAQVVHPSKACCIVAPPPSLSSCPPYISSQPGEPESFGAHPPRLFPFTSKPIIVNRPRKSIHEHPHAAPRLFLKRGKNAFRSFYSCGQGPSTRESRLGAIFEIMRLNPSRPRRGPIACGAERPEGYADAPGEDEGYLDLPRHVQVLGVPKTDRMGIGTIGISSNQKRCDPGVALPLRTTNKPHRTFRACEGL